MLQRLKQLGFALLITFSAFVQGNLQADERPNFLWIMSEDNSKHYLKMFDENGASTPNIEKMAAHGITFDRAFSNAPVCSVARTTLITSVYAPRLGTQFHRNIQQSTLPDDWKMFPEYLKKAGYYTTNNAKKDYNCNEGDVWSQSSNKAHWSNRAEGQPFFHVQTYTDSHESSLHFPQSWVDNPDNKTDPASVTLNPYHPDTPLFRLTYARYHDRIQVIDDKVGKLISQLEEAGELENTFVFYFGDHGGVLPRGKGFANESGLHVPLVVRVPDKFKSLAPLQMGARTNGFVEFVDFGPTVLNLAGIGVPAHVDGLAFLGDGVTRESIENRNETFGYADRMDEKYDMVRTLRRGKWKYIRNYQAIYPDGLQNNYRYINLAWQQWRQLYRDDKLTEIQKAFFEPKPAEQLFDISKDPHEIKNLAGQAEHQAKLVELRVALTERLKSMPDLSFFSESYLVEDGLKTPIELGQKSKARIGELIDVADLALLSHEQAVPGILAAAKSDDPFKRYWAYSVASIHGKATKSLVNAARNALTEDDDLLVRLRAVEFLGTTGSDDPCPVIAKLVSESESPTVNLIALQTFVHFKDRGYGGYDTTLNTGTIKAVDSQLLRRIGYLDNISQKEIVQRQRAMGRKGSKKSNQNGKKQPK